MFNSYKSIADLFSEASGIVTLTNANSYLAHRSVRNGVKSESLAEHIELVQKYANLLCKYNHLDEVIDKLITDFTGKCKHFPAIEKQQEVGEFIKQLFANSIIFHDHGKINENFQASPLKMNNPSFETIPNHPLETHHSGLSAYLYITKHFQDFYDTLPRDQHLILSIVVLAFSYPILKHHGKQFSDQPAEQICFSKKEVDVMKHYITQFQFRIDQTFQENIPLNTSKILNCIDRLSSNFSLYALLKLNYSLLTASDYLATNEYMSGMKLCTEADFGLITDELRKKTVQNIQTQKPYNQEAYQKYSISYDFQNPTLKSNENLNTLRQEMSIRLIQNIRNNADKILFYIEAPTGGGKTNLSMIAAAELLKTNRNLNKVFYVFPFTTLITQTHKALLETLGLSSNEVTQVHSKAGFTSKEKKEEQEDGLYGDEKRNFIDHLFINYPFCLLTHIKFFDILKTNEKETNYLLHRLANSIVIIDELQSYNPEHWDKLIYFITNYAHFFNIRFILMSATLPKLGNLEVFKKYNAAFTYLLGEQVKENYFLNPNFKDRVEFRFDLIEDKILESLEYGSKINMLADFLIEKVKAYAEKESGKNKPHGSVYAIIEFIFKKSAAEFYRIIDQKQQQDKFFDEVFVLSGTILEHRRKQIINFLKSKDNRKRRILLITTQVVEAGVDIDMDLGFKDISLIDSDEQLAGRINRNINKPQCELYLFKLDKASLIYGKDERFDFTREKLQSNIYKEVLQTKNFDKLYNEVFTKIDRLNQSEMIKNFSSYESEIKFLNFQKVNKEFKLIDQENLSVFVPMDIPIKVDGEERNKKDRVFSDNELTFLSEQGITVREGKISGSQVFDLYVMLIENRNPDFVQGKINLKQLQGIMSKFTFSIFKGKDTEQKFIEFSDVEKNNYGYIYLNGWNRDSINPLYHENFGINEMAFKESNFI